MAWVKLDDAMPHHPKVMAAGPQAFALDVAGICYSNKHATDGFIADASLAAVYPALSNPRKWAEKLAEVGRWHRVEGGWRIHDVDDYQPTAAEQREISRKRAKAGKQGGTKSGQVRGSKPEAQSKQVASEGVEANGKPDPTPTRPPELRVLPQASSEEGSGGEAMLPAEKWARRWCEIRGVQPTRAVLRNLIPKVIEYIGDAGEPTDGQLREAHRKGIEHPGGWAYFVEKAPYDPEDEPEFIKEFRL